MAVRCPLAQEDERQWYSELKLSSFEPLETATRQRCPECTRSRKYFCYECYCFVGVNSELMPKVFLPIEVDIVKHPLEAPGKSTAIHARVLAPSSVNLYTFPEFPDYREEDGTVLVYPGKNAQDLSCLISSRQGPNVAEGFKKVKARKMVFIDSTWQQANAILRDERMSALPCVKLADTTTKFWRPQHKRTPECLATIEAVYYLFKRLYELVHEKPYYGSFDNLLYFFVFQYKRIWGPPIS